MRAGVRVRKRALQVMRCRRPRTVAAGEILVLPLFNAEDLLVVYPLASSPEELVVLYVKTCPGAFSATSKKILTGGALENNPQEMGVLVQVPCQTARQIQKEDFLVKEKVQWPSHLAATAYSPQGKSGCAKDRDVDFFSTFVLPNFLGADYPVESEWKMVEHSLRSYAPVRFGLQVLITHVLRLPKSVYKRLIILGSLFAVRHVVGYYSDPCGSVARLPHTALSTMVQFLNPSEARRLAAVSRLESYKAFGVVRALARVAAGSPKHLRHLEDLYCRKSLLDGQQRVARKLAKLAAGFGDDVQLFASLVSAELSQHQDELQTSGALARLRSLRADSANLHAALMMGMQEASGEFCMPEAWHSFLRSARSLLDGESAGTCPNRELGRAKLGTQLLQGGPSRDHFDSLVKWMSMADHADGLRAALHFEEAVLELALSGSSLQDWQTSRLAAEGNLATDVCHKLFNMLEVYCALCAQQGHPRTALRHSRMVLVVWTLACLQDSLLRNRGENCLRRLLKDFAPPLAIHPLEHLLLREIRWLKLLSSVEVYLMGLSHMPHRLLVCGADGVKDLLSLADAAVRHLPSLKDAWASEVLAAQELEERRAQKQMDLKRWVQSLEMEIEQDVKRQRVSSQERPSSQSATCPRNRFLVEKAAKRRRVCDTELSWKSAKSGLTHCQAQASSDRQLELQSVRRPLASVVQALPQLAEHELEAKAVVLCAHLPKELAELGASFSLARHFFDFEAGWPAEARSRPAFSWLGHFREFSRCCGDAVGGREHFELFGTTPQTYRDGEQLKSYLMPVKENLGIYYPTEELKGLHLLWRWQGVLLNPFVQEWPQKRDPPDPMYCVELPEEFVDEQWMLALPPENEVLAQMPLPPKGFTKAQFRSLGFIASQPELHLRRLLPSIHKAELPLQDPRVLALCQQVLFRAGPRNEEEPACLLGRCCKADLEEVAAWPSAEGLCEQVRALELQRGPLDALVCLMACCGYLAQFNCSRPQLDNRDRAQEAFRQCQQLLLSWMQDAGTEHRSPGHRVKL